MRRSKGQKVYSSYCHCEDHHDAATERSDILYSRGLTVRNRHTHGSPQLTSSLADEKWVDALHLAAFSFLYLPHSPIFAYAHILIYPFDFLTF
jgi:hypothetical protein